MGGGRRGEERRARTGGYWKSEEGKGNEGGKRITREEELEEEEVSSALGGEEEVEDVDVDGVEASARGRWLMVIVTVTYSSLMGCLMRVRVAGRMNDWMVGVRME